MLTQHQVWLRRLAAKYNRPVAELASVLSRPGALETEIAMLLSDAALSVAERLLEEREQPDTDSDELFDRAVRGHYARLQRAVVAQSAQSVMEVRSRPDVEVTRE
jgi:hypothetical protein